MQYQMPGAARCDVRNHKNFFTSATQSSQFCFAKQGTLSGQWTLQTTLVMFMRQTGSQLPLKNCLFWRVGGRLSFSAANHVILLFKSATFNIKSKVNKQTCLGRSMCVPWANRIDRGWGAECGLWFRRCEYGSKTDAEGTTILIMFNFEYSLVLQPSIPKLSSIWSHDHVKMERWPSHTRVISLVGTRHTPERPAKGLLLERGIHDLFVVLFGYQTSNRVWGPLQLSIG